MRRGMWVLCGLGLAGCSADPPATPKLDLVIVVENAGSMREKQAAFASHVPALLTALRGDAAELPDLHVAILSSDLGAGPRERGSCKPGGSGGNFELRASCGVDPATTTERFLSLNRNGRNFIGEPANVIGCAAQLGIVGCGFEHHLQSLRLALTSTPTNRGFLRPDADLGIVILAEEDDCSASADTTIFDDNATSFRCAELGHACGGTPVPARAGFSAPLASCTAIERTASEPLGERLFNVSEFVTAIKTLKPGREDRIAVAAFLGWNDAATYVVNTDGSDAPRTGAVCSTTETGEAWPALRLRTFTRSFPRHLIRPICSLDAPAMTAVGQLLRAKAE